jgi:hypothetical protein
MLNIELLTFQPLVGLKWQSKLTTHNALQRQCLLVAKPIAVTRSPYSDHHCQHYHPNITPQSANKSHHHFELVNANAPDGLSEPMSQHRLNQTTH